MQAASLFLASHYEVWERAIVSQDTGTHCCAILGKDGNIGHTYAEKSPRSREAGLILARLAFARPTEH
jgi:hypothetical protein